MQACEADGARVFIYCISFPFADYFTVLLFGRRIIMRAIIDIGTNSVRLLVAEKDDKEEWKVLKKDLRSTLLG